MGSRFHDFAENLFKLIDYDALDDAKSYEEVRRIFMLTKNKIKLPRSIATYAHAQCLFETGRVMEMKSLDQLQYFKPRAIENKYVTKVWDDHTFSGIIDRIDNTLDGGIALIEYKLSRRLNAASVFKQLTFYAILLEYLGGFPPVTHLVGYSPIDNQLVQDKLTPRRRKSVEKRIRKMIEEVENGIFNRKETPFCLNCNYLDDCDYCNIDLDDIIKLLGESAWTAVEMARHFDAKQTLIQDYFDLLWDEERVNVAKKGRSSYYWMKTED